MKNVQPPLSDPLLCFAWQRVYPFHSVGNMLAIAYSLLKLTKQTLIAIHMFLLFIFSEL